MLKAEPKAKDRYITCLCFKFTKNTICFALPSCLIIVAFVFYGLQFNFYQVNHVARILEQQYEEFMISETSRVIEDAVSHSEANIQR